MTATRIQTREEARAARIAAIKCEICQTGIGQGIRIFQTGATFRCADHIATESAAAEYERRMAETGGNYAEEEQAEAEAAAIAARHAEQARIEAGQDWDYA